MEGWKGGTMRDVRGTVVPARGAGDAAQRACVRGRAAAADDDDVVDTAPCAAVAAAMAAKATSASVFL